MPNTHKIQACQSPLLRPLSLFVVIIFVIDMKCGDWDQFVIVSLIMDGATSAPEVKITLERDFTSSIC
jgi:hypothetical protein